MEEKDDEAWYERGAINDIYGQVFDNVISPHRGEAHEWITTKRPKGNAGTLAASLAFFIRKVKSEKRKNG